MVKISFGLLFGGLIIFLLSFFIFLPSFNLALFGDDWLAIWRYLEQLGPKSSGQWNHLTYFLTPYGAQDILMGFLNKLFGFQSLYYYILSFLFRLFAAFSLYPLIFYLTRNKVAAFFSILFLSITIIGIETTNWVFNMPSYITLGLFNLTLYFFIKSREEKHFKNFSFAAILYYFAYIITPIRMHGSLPFLFLLDFFWMVQKRDTKNFKKGCIRLLIILAIFLFIRFTGQSLGPSNEITERLSQGFNVSRMLLNQGRYDFILHPLIMFGGMLIPDFFVQQLVGASDINFTSLLLSILFLFFFLILILIISNASRHVSKKFFLKYLLCTLIYTSVIWILFPKKILPFPNNTLTPSASLILANIGGYFLTLLTLLLIENLEKEKISTSIFISIIWPFFSFFAAWWFTPQVIFPTTYRYLTISTTGISVFFAVIISLGSNDKKKLLLTSILSVALILHVISTNYYLKTMASFRNQQISSKIWSSIPYIPEVGKEHLVFYFETENNNYMILYNTVTFGFPPHMQLLYGLSQHDFAPVPMENWAEVVSAVKDGQSFKAYGYPLKPIPIDHVYAFRLSGQDNLINITDIARQKLAEENPLGQ